MGAAPRLVSNPELSNIQKAAVFVMYLEREAARALLRNLTDDEVKLIGAAINGLGEVDEYGRLQLLRLRGDRRRSLQGRDDAVPHPREPARPQDRSGQVRRKSIEEESATEGSQIQGNLHDDTGKEEQRRRSSR